MTSVVRGSMRKWNDLKKNKGASRMDSVIFDLDGTLWDSRDSVANAWNKAAQQNNIDQKVTKQDLKRTMGLQMGEIIDRLFPRLTTEAHELFMKDCNRFEKLVLEEKGGILYEDVEVVLRDLATKYKLYIVSNCQDGYIEAFYTYHKLDHYFLDFENPGRTGLSKGENIKLVMERNELSSPIYVGDTEGDRKASVDTGIPFIFASYGFGEVDHYDRKIEAFAELRELL